jgi:hypothetical protein
MSPITIPQPQKRKSVSDAIDGIREHDVNPLDLDDPIVHAVAGIPMNLGPITDNTKSSVVLEAIEWLQTKNPSHDGLDNPTVYTLSKLNGAPLS